MKNEHLEQFIHTIAEELCKEKVNHSAGGVVNIHKARVGRLDGFAKKMITLKKKIENAAESKDIEQSASVSVLDFSGAKK